MDKQKGKKKSKKKWIVTSVILVVVCGAVGFTVLNNMKSQETIAVVAVKTMPLKKTTITDTISVSGAIYSASTKNIYSSQDYLIKEVYVEVGDEVKIGDVLAEFDMSSVGYDLRQAQNDITSAEVSSLEDNKALNNSITNAGVSLESSEISLEKQQLNYDTLKKEYENGTSTSLVNAKNTMDNDLTNLESAKKKSSNKAGRL